jgi:UDP-N-acetylmuramoyl-L-alanyl-D-glutamate--2,6-diaminopimelate ligase
MMLEEMLFSTGIDCPIKWKTMEITGVSYDSRKIKKGNAFVCLKGQNTDGHIYAIDAAFRGASVVISEQDLELTTVPVLRTDDSRKTLSIISANYYGHPAEEMTVFGITGTNGKTTVSYMIKSGLEAWGQTCGLMGTISYKLGNKEYEATRTTPESLELQIMFAEMRDLHLQNCVMEVSSHALQLGRVQGVSFDYAVFTNLTQDHMDFHKDHEEYYQAKKKLFTLTRKAGIINIDDNNGKRVYQELVQSKK